MPANDRITRALSLLGFATGAGRVPVGVPLICEALKKGGAKAPRLVLLAADASANSAKRIADRTRFYGVPCHRLTVDGGRLALAVGKPDATVAAVAVCDTQFAKALAEALQNPAE